MKNNAQPNTTAQQASPKILTVSEVSELLKIPPSSVYEKTRRRRGSVPPLPVRKVGKYLRFFEHEVLQWLTALPQNSQRRAA